MTETEPEVPVLRANDDLGDGFRVVFEAQDRHRLLVAEGASLIGSNQGDTVRISLRSDRQDFEFDYFYLLDAEMVVGNTLWVGPLVCLQGVLTKFCWRTEDELTEELKSCPSGDGIYVPKGPLPEGGKGERGHLLAWQGQPYPMIQVNVSVGPRMREEI
jgi:hypothetical protein